MRPLLDRSTVGGQSTRVVATRLDALAWSDLTNFYKAQHSDIQGLSITTDLMMELAVVRTF